MKRIDRSKSAFNSMSPFDQDLLPEQHFQRAIVLERKRAERSGKSFLLMLVESSECSSSEERGRLMSDILLPLSLSTRETDILGWYNEDVSLGVIFTEISIENKASISEAMRTRITEVLRNRLNAGQLRQI